MMYASRISFLCGAELLNCLWMLARRCCGREAIFIELRRTAEDMVTMFSGGMGKKIENAEKRNSHKSICGYHMAATVPPALDAQAECGGMTLQHQTEVRQCTAPPGLRRFLSTLHYALVDS